MNTPFWQDFFRQITPVLMPLLMGTPVVTLLVHLLSRHDKINKAKVTEGKGRDANCEAYKRAYWLSEGFAKHISQIVGPAIIAWKKGDSATAGAMLEIVFHSLCETQGGELKLKAMPDHFKIAKIEIKSAQAQAESAAEEGDTA